MELKPGAGNKIQLLIDKGVEVPNPFSVHVGDEVDIDHISGRGVTINPGCRIFGAETVISDGAVLGREGPATIEDCQLGPSVELKGGYFRGSIFLEKSNLGYGAHVREGCILEEQAGGAHCVGLKQTILFPFVTLGSLINFCDCLMAGGTSRKNHSEVGSSYIHFNFTPDGDKTTPSLIGDVPRGVMLNQPPIFLGGQGGIVGPVRLGFGNVVAAGTILKNDVPEDRKLIVGKTQRECVIDLIPMAYPRLARIVANNVIYIANLLALEQWYTHVRRQFFLSQEFGPLIYRGALKNLAGAIQERLKRLEAMSGKVSEAGASSRPGKPAEVKVELRRNIGELPEILNTAAASNIAVQARDRFLNDFQSHLGSRNGDYIESIQSLPLPVSRAGSGWLGEIVAALCSKVRETFPSMALFPDPA